jgi:hypothetical protein
MLSQKISLEIESKYSFWYYMYGKNVGNLTFSIDNQVIWNKIGSQQDKWLSAKIYLPDGEYNVKSVNRSKN